jgi:hypothetical protein
LPDRRMQISQPSYPKPIAKNSNGSASHELPLFQVGLVPQTRVTNGLSARPTIPLATPYSLKIAV